MALAVEKPYTVCAAHAAPCENTIGINGLESGPGLAGRRVPRIGVAMTFQPSETALRKLVLALSSALAVALPHLSASAAPVYSPLTGNYYDYINQDGQTGAFTSWNWLEARADAESRTYLGRTGHLVTLTSQVEEEVLIDNWLGDILYGQAIIGGFRPAGSDPVAGWQWVTGETFSYTNWGVNEPNNAGGEELYLHYQSIGVSSVTQFESYGWNDMLNERRGYFIEFSTVPTPGTLPLVALAGLGLVMGRRRGGRKPEGQR